MDYRKILFGCVSDNNPHYLMQSLLLLQSLRWYGGKQANSDFMVCVVDNIPSYFADAFHEYGANIHIVQRYHVLSPPSNKIQFFLTPFISDYDHIVLLDCDTIILQDPSPFIFPRHFAAKIADYATVTEAVFKKLFVQLQLKLPKQTEKTSLMQTPTIPYFNSGVLIFTRTALLKILPFWVYYNTLLLNNLAWLTPCEYFCDQASLALALISAGKKLWQPLPLQMNFPLHIPETHFPISLLNSDATIVHHHGLVDKHQGYLLPTYLPKIQKRLAGFNQKLAKARQHFFNNGVFWDYRYYSDPELKLGSGLGSRGDALTYKKNSLADFLADAYPLSILDVGCGDCFVTDSLPLENYTGIDFSHTIIAANHQKFPQRKFIAGDFLLLSIELYDVLICFDVLIHQSLSCYGPFVKKLVASVKKKCILSGYEEKPHHASEITFYHGPLSNTLKQAGARNIKKIGEYRSTVIFSFDK